MWHQFRPKLPLPYITVFFSFLNPPTQPAGNPQQDYVITINFSVKHNSKRACPPPSLSLSLTRARAIHTPLKSNINSSPKKLLLSRRAAAAQSAMQIKTNGGREREFVRAQPVARGRFFLLSAPLKLPRREKARGNKEYKLAGSRAWISKVCPFVAHSSLIQMNFTKRALERMRNNYSRKYI